MIAVQWLSLIALISGHVAAEERPHIVFILADDLVSWDFRFLGELGLN